MTASLYPLVYCSRNTITGSPADLAVEVQGILASARRHNAKVGVTGALLFTSTWFAQVLEGPREAVEAVFERIQLDMRHREVTILGFSCAEERGFPAWSMAFAGESTTVADETLADLVPRSDKLETRTTAARDVLDLLQRVIKAENN